MGPTVKMIANQLNIDENLIKDYLTKKFPNQEFNSDSSLNVEELKVISLWTKQHNQIDKPLNQQDEKARNYLEYVVKYAEVIFIDTSSLLQTASIEFLQNIKGILIKHDKKLILPFKVYEELQKHLKNERDVSLAQKSKSILLELKKFQMENVLEIYGDDTLDNFADNVFQMQITRLRVQKTVLLITNDISLGKDILQLNESKSVNGKKIFVQKVNRFGYLNIILSDNVEKRKLPHPQKNIKDTERFNLTNTPVRYREEILGYIKDVGENDFVYDEHSKPIKLLHELGKGGEGSVFTTSIEGYVAKIYKKEKVTSEKIDKLKLMISKNIEYEGICYPKALLFNDQKEFIGYLMPKAEGKELRHFLFIPKKVLETRNPSWKRVDLVKLCLTILDKFAYLHDRNVVLGDINPFNILVVSAEKVYFVDVDSYQVEGFPCPVGTINYTAPEIQGKNYKDFLRTFGNEYFAVATLLFNILFLGKSPYSQTGGESDASNIREMDFPYTFKKDERADNTPKGQWRFIWSNMPYSVKKAFYETFQKGEIHSTEETRMDIKQWQKVFYKYHQELVSGKLQQQDEMANEIFPNRFKVIGDNKENLKECRICSQSFFLGSLNKGICRSCLNKGEDYNCAKCNKELIFTNFEKYVRNLNTPYKYCKDCEAYLNRTYQRFLCTSCKTNFNFSFKDKEFYDNKGFDYPKRCQSCRKNKNTINNNNGIPKSSPNVPKNMPNSTIDFSDSSTPNFPKPQTRPEPPKPTKKKSRWCYLTTVACEYYSLSDDCYELNMLRNYRDNWLSQQKYGSHIIKEYYESAPYIVQAIKASHRYNDYCEWIMKDIVLPCVKFIEQGKMEDCFNLYYEMVKTLQNIFIGDDAPWKKTN